MGQGLLTPHGGFCEHCKKKLLKKEVDVTTNDRTYQECYDCFYTRLKNGNNEKRTTKTI